MNGISALNDTRGNRLPNIFQEYLIEMMEDCALVNSSKPLLFSEVTREHTSYICTYVCMMCDKKINKIYELIADKLETLLFKNKNQTNKFYFLY